MPTCSTIVWEKTHPCLWPILHFSSIFIYALLEHHLYHILFSQTSNSSSPTLLQTDHSASFCTDQTVTKDPSFTHITRGLTPVPVLMYSIPSRHLSFSHSISNLLLLHLLSESIQNLSHSTLLGIHVCIYIYIFCMYSR